MMKNEALVVVLIDEPKALISVIVVMAWWNDPFPFPMKAPTMKLTRPYSPPWPVTQAIIWYWWKKPVVKVITQRKKNGDARNAM